MLANPDNPFSRVILIPFDGITVIHGELMVEVVITFANSCKSSDDMVAWGVFIIERCLSEPMSKGVHAKGGLEERLMSMSQKKKIA